MDMSIHCTRTVGSRIASNASLLFGAKAIGALLGLISLVVTARALDSQAEFGIVIFFTRLHVVLCRNDDVPAMAGRDSFRV